VGNAIRKLAVSDFLPIFFAHIFLAIDALEGLVRGVKDDKYIDKVENIIRFYVIACC